MRLTVRVLGREVLHIVTGDPPSEAPDYTATPVGFAPSPGDQRWERPILDA